MYLASFKEMFVSCAFSWEPLYRHGGINPCGENFETGSLFSVDYSRGGYN